MSTVGRRAVLQGGAALGVLVAAPAAAGAIGVEGMGEWLDGPLGLPAYRYTGPLTFGGRPMLPDDPWFLLGNHRLTAFVHASGRLRWLSGERGWVDLLSEFTAVATVDGRTIRLTGVSAEAAARADKTFGVGAARFVYALAPGLTLARTLAVRPSAVVGQGEAAMLVTLDIANTGSATRTVLLHESGQPEYRPVRAPWAGAPPVNFATQVTHHPASRVMRAATTATATRPLVLPPRPRASQYDAEPPTLWLAAIDRCEIDAFGVAATLTLAPGQSVRVRYAIGHAFGRDDVGDRATADALAGAASDNAFAPEWRQNITSFSGPRSNPERREAQWNAAMLDQMATWRDYYDETIVPQGTTYDYDWGLTLGTRDIAQHALPLCRTRPALAHSALRYILKRTSPDGEIKLGDSGYGWIPEGSWVPSDQQLYTFLLATEYLERTGDMGLLTEPLAWHPVETGTTATGLVHLERAFVFLRDRIGVGAHGLVRLLNSDWNDLFYFWPKPLPYAELYGSAESHLNTALAIVALGRLAAQLERLSPEARPLAAAMSAWRADLLAAFMKDWGDRAFPRRAYLGKAGSVGEEEMWLEPVGFSLMIPEVPVAKKRALADAMDARLLVGEPLGPRQIERTTAQKDLAPGQRENGGAWFALTGPAVLGLATFDPARARALANRMSFAAYASAHPGAWTGAWTNSDSVDSARLPSGGLSAMAPWCAHAHAWPLQAWLDVGAARG